MINPSIKDIADAIEENGWKQIYNGDYYEYDLFGELIGACAIGQAAKNLNMGASSLHFNLNSLGYVSCPSKNCGYSNVTGTIIIHLNDDHHWKLSSIAKWLRKVYAA